MADLSFALILVSSMLPLITAATRIYSFHLSFFIVATAFILALARDRIALPAGLPKHLYTQLIVLALLLPIQLATGHGFGILSGGGYVVLLTACFYIFLRRAVATPDQLWKRLAQLYKFFIVTLLIEACIILAGGQPALADTFKSDSGPSYKTYNQADLAKLLGLFSDSGGCNSIFLGSQIAGMVSLFALIVFARRQHSGLGRSKPDLGWAALAILSLFLTLNGTTSLLGIVCVLLLLASRVAKRKVLLAAGIASIATYLLIENGLVFSRIFSSAPALTDYQLGELERFGADGSALKGATLKDYYLYMFFSPIRVWVDVEPFEQLFGISRDRLSTIFVSGDFGYAASVLLKSGLLWAAVFLFGTLSICSRFLHRCSAPSREGKSWRTFGLTNAIVGLLWLVSMVHYPQATENLGAFPLFALHLALVLICDQKLHRATEELGACRNGN